MFIRMIHCGTHGKLVLSNEQYAEQMNKANSRWYCPECKGVAHFVGEYYQCHCNTLIEVGEDVCPNCKFDHFEAYLKETGQWESATGETNGQ